MGLGFMGLCFCFFWVPCSRSGGLFGSMTGYNFPFARARVNTPSPTGPRYFTFSLLGIRRITLETTFSECFFGALLGAKSLEAEQFCM